MKKKELTIRDGFGDKIGLFMNGAEKTCILVNSHGVALHQHEAIQVIQHVAQMNGLVLDLKIPISYRGRLDHKVSPATALHYSLKAGQVVTNGDLFTSIVKFEKGLK